MSSKLIMKRKLEYTQHSPVNNKADVDVNECSASTLPSTSSSTLNKQNNQSKKKDEAFVIQPEIKRICCDTSTSDNLDSSIKHVNRQNRHLLEAIQLKMLELQQELDEFEHDVEAHEEDHYYINNHQNNKITEHEAEALGFAMCAQETMLFLEKEGIPSDSPIYTRLLDALVGRSQSDRTLNI